MNWMREALLLLPPHVLTSVGVLGVTAAFFAVLSIAARGFALSTEFVCWLLNRRSSESKGKSDGV